MSAPDRFALLCAALEKAPCPIAEQAGNAHVLLVSRPPTVPLSCAPHPTIVDQFFATASKAVHGIPERLVHPDWKLWACSPEIANKVLKAGVFTMADAKFLREPSPPASSSSSSVDEERDLLPSLRKEKETASSSRTSSKHPKRDQERELSPLPSKKEATTTKRKGTDPSSHSAPEKSQVKGRGCKTVVKEEPTVPRAKEPTPPPAILAEDTAFLCQHKEPLMTCTNCNNLSASDLQEVHDNLLTSAQAAYPCSFNLPTARSCHLLNALHKNYGIRTAALCNMLQAFTQVEGDHDTDALVNFARQFPVGRRLLIDMGLVSQKEKDELELPQLPEFTILENQTSTPRTSRSSARSPVGSDNDEEDDEAEGDQMSSNSSPAHPVKHPGTSVIPPSLTNSSFAWPGPSMSGSGFGGTREVQLGPYWFWERDWNRPPSQIFPPSDTYRRFGPF
ncbi:uncharacterized protein EV420DRAFT_1561988 [Desarmillaria tabescens]|uniref:Uncharacterized protein n=1 Tax=Armillaria tabescens TaxID=1929756 RepID=A0AA39JX12_ARMTA|nr:uncharacterized protein EV420DRAFT_1561988 [Desarmillaria tabescens]KAK0450475.1 hypothetical protein EV420DRAFT_1561988 [Desarmillaria tabescens]